MKVEPTGVGLVVEADGEGDTEALGRALAEVVTPGTVIGLVGPLGAGKTRLTRAIAEALGVAPGAISSPTFVLIHEYAGRLPVFHFDAYRLKAPAEFEALGAADYFDADGLCLVEWADRVAEILPPDTWWVRITADPSAPTRRFALDLPDPAAPALSARLAAD